MRFITTFLICLTLLVNYAEASLSVKFPFNFIQKVLLDSDLSVGNERENVADLSYGIGLQVPNLQVFEGLGLAAGYSAAVAPAHHEDYYARLDTWKLNVNLTPGTVIQEALALPVRFGIKRDQEIVFVRFFPSREEAATASPRHLGHLPLTARRAIKHLNPGDLVSIPAKLSMVGQLVGSKSFVPFIKGSIGTHLLASGEFQINLLRMQNGRVRLRILSRQAREWGIITTKLKAGVKLFGLKFDSGKIKVATSINVAKFQELRNRGHLSFFDYIFDLRDQKAAEAFNSIVSSTWKLQPSPVLAPIKKGELSGSFVSDLTKTEFLFDQDKDKPEEARRVNRVFKGIDDYSQRSRILKLGLGLVSYKGQATYTEHDLIYHNSDDIPASYFYATSTATRKHKVLFGLRYAKWTRSVSALFKKDETGNIGDFECLSFSFMRKDRKMSADEQRDLRWFTCANLPESIYRSINWREWNFTTPRLDAKYHYQAFFHAKTFEILKRLTKEELFLQLELFMDNLVIPLSWRKKNKRRLEAMVETLYRVTRAAPEEERKRNIRQAVELRRNRAFRDIGAGYIMWLIPQKQWAEAFHVRLKLKGRDIKKTKLSFGSLADETFYHDLFYLQELLDNASFELRAEAVVEKADWDEEKEKTEKTETLTQEKRRSRFESLYDD